MIGVYTGGLSPKKLLLLAGFFSMNPVIDTRLNKSSPSSPAYTPSHPRPDKSLNSPNCHSASPELCTHRTFRAAQGMPQTVSCGGVPRIQIVPIRSDLPDEWLGILNNDPEGAGDFCKSSHPVARVWWHHVPETASMYIHICPIDSFGLDHQDHHTDHTPSTSPVPPQWSRTFLAVSPAGIPAGEPLQG